MGKMRRKVRKGKNSSSSSSNNLKKNQKEQRKKESLFDSDILTAKEKKWLNNNNSKLKCKIIRQYLPEENLLKWKPIPKTSKNTLKKLVSKTLLG